LLIGKNVNAHLYIGMKGVSTLKLIGTTNGGHNSTIPTIILFTGIIILVIVIFASRGKKNDN
jgi:phosphate starvation-inducible membrane PsiE